jgi:hypothetical protein
MKNITLIIGTLLLIFILAMCSANSDAPVTDTGEAATSTETVASEASASTNSAATTSVDAVPVTLAQLSTPHDTAEDATWDSAAATSLVLSGDAITVEGAGVSVEGSKATITAAGAYNISGGLSDGQIVVDTEDSETVYLILNGVDLHNATSAPIFVSKAQETVIVLADNTQNSIEDGASYVFADPQEDEPNAALFSKTNLTITGNGALSVQGNYNDGIASKDGLVINSGTIAVNAVDDGIRGKDYLVIKDCAITVNSQGDGLKSDNEDDATVGYILIESGAIQVNAGGDAITAQSNVLVTGGEFNLVSGGGSAVQIDETLSAKGIKAAVAVQIDGGVFTIDAADDAVHSNDSITINGGIFAITTGDDGMHADKTLTINDGETGIAESYEGIEAAVITINGGGIHIVSSDDGVNVAGGNDGSGMMRGGPRGAPGDRPPRPQGDMPPGGMPAAPGQETFTYTGDYYLYINGGYLVVDAAGDGIDVNGAIVMTDGMVIVNGPTMDMNAALDYDATFTIEGGFLVAAGSVGMAQAPGGASTQNSLLLNYSATQPAGALTHIQDSQGNDILTFAPAKQYQSLSFSSPALVTGETYTVFSGGSFSGVATDGLVQDGVYSPGAEYTSFTVENVVTMIGSRGR